MSNLELQGKVIGSPSKAMEAVASSRSIFMLMPCLHCSKDIQQPCLRLREKVFLPAYHNGPLCVVLD